MKLYELNEEIEIAERAINEYAEKNEGDITDCPFEVILEDLKGEKDAKLLGLSVWYKNLNAEAKAIAEEVKVLGARKSAIANKAERLKDFIEASLEPNKKLSDSKVSLSWRKSQAVAVTVEAEDLPLEYIKTTIAPDKTAIKTALNSGKEIMGVDLVNNLNLQIK